MSKKTTVIIPNYNGAKYIENCLAFLKKSKNTEFDIIVVDNASSDDSLYIIRENFPAVKLICMETNTGFSKAVNVGIKEAKTKYVLLLNNDTVVEPDFVYELEKMMDKHKKAFSIASKMLSMSDSEIIDGTGDFYCSFGWAFARGKGKSANKYSRKDRVFSACAGAAIYRKEVFEKIGYFDELHFAYLEDTDVGYRARIYGYENLYCPKAIVYHAGSGVSGSRYNAFKVNLSSRNSIYLIAKNMPFLQVVLNLPLLLIGYLIKIMFFSKKGFGKVYIKGLWKGFCLSFSKEGRSHKIPFRLKHLWNYIRIQGLLWAGCIQRFMY